MKTNTYILILPILLVTGVVVPLLLRTETKIFGLPTGFLAGFLLALAVAALALVIRRLMS